MGSGLNAGLDELNGLSSQSILPEFLYIAYHGERACLDGVSRRALRLRDIVSVPLVPRRVAYCHFFLLCSSDVYSFFALPLVIT